MEISRVFFLQSSISEMAIRGHFERVTISPAALLKTKSGFGKNVFFVGTQTSEELILKNFRQGVSWFNLEFRIRFGTHMFDEQAQMQVTSNLIARLRKLKTLNREMMLPMVVFAGLVCTAMFFIDRYSVIFDAILCASGALLLWVLFSFRVIHYLLQRTMRRDLELIQWHFGS